MRNLIHLLLAAVAVILLSVPLLLLMAACPTGVGSTADDVSSDDPEAPDTAQITDFLFAASDNATLSEDVAGEITGTSIGG